MKKWSLSGLVITIILIILVGLLGIAFWFMHLPQWFIPIAGLALVVQYILLFLLANSLTSNITKASWHADEEGRLLIFLVRDDKTFRAVIGRRVGGNLVEFEIDGVKTIYVIHPESILAHPGSKAHYTIAYAKSAVTIPPEALRLGFDVRHLHGHSHAAFVLLLSKTEKSLEETINELKKIMEEIKELKALEAEARVESRRLLDEKKRQVAAVLSKFGIQIDPTTVDWDGLLLRLQYELEVLEAEAKSITPGIMKLQDAINYIMKLYPHKVLVIDPHIKAVTASEIQAVVPTLSPIWALEQIKERAEWLAILRMKSLVGLQGPKIPWGWLLLGGIILLIVLVLMQSGGFESLGQSIGSMIPGLSSTPTPTPTPTPAPGPAPAPAPPAPAPAPVPPVPEIPTPTPIPTAPLPGGGGNG